MSEPATGAERPRGGPPPVAISAELPRKGPWQILRERVWVVLIVLGLSVGAGVAYIGLTPPMFTSTSRLYVEQAGPRIIGEREGTPTQSKTFLYNQAELLKSTPILGSALDAPGIRDLATFAGADNPLAALRDHLAVEVGRKDDILNVSFEAPRAQDAALVANAVVDAYVTCNSKQKRSTALEVLKILQKEKTKRDAELEAAFKAMMEFKRQNPSMALEDEKGSVVTQRLEQLSSALTAAEVATMNAQVEYETLVALMSEPDTAHQLVDAQRARGNLVSFSAEADRLREELDKAQSHLRVLRQQGTDNLPAVQNAQARADKIARELEEINRKFVESQLAMAYQQYAAAQLKEDELRQAFEKQREAALQLANKVDEYRLMEMPWKRTKELTDVLDARIKELSITEDTGALNIRIVEVGRPPEEPSSPHTARILAAAVVAGLLLGAALALAQEGLDQRLHSSDEVAATLGVPVLGSVPIISGKDLSLRDVGLKMLRDPRCRAAEAYRAVRTALYFGVPSGAARTLLVTSPEEGDGKSVLVSNLAIAIAQAGQRVLVVDADFHKPVQHKIFDAVRGKRLYQMMREHITRVLQKIDQLPEDKPKPSVEQLLGSRAFDDMLKDLSDRHDRAEEQEDGLSGVLSGRQSLDANIVQTVVPGLDLLPCGTVPPNPAELLNSRAFADLLKEVSSRYDYTLLDSPPVLPLTDARIIGAMCDMTILVVRAEKTSRKAALLARHGLVSVGAHILGAVVNAVPHKVERYYYGGYVYSPHYTRERETNGAASTMT